jgi:hypothetical protein
MQGEFWESIHRGGGLSLLGTQMNRGLVTPVINEAEGMHHITTSASFDYPQGRGKHPPSIPACYHSKGLSPVPKKKLPPTPTDTQSLGPA